MLIPYTAISTDALYGVIEEFVTREGTEYGHSDHSLDAKVRSVLKQLQAGTACLFFDSETESCDIVIKGSPRYLRLVSG
jgi:uncharacterized protein YheU (UPF0270 family)